MYELKRHKKNDKIKWVLKILQNKYSQDTITDVVEVDLWEKDYFVLTVMDKVEHSSTVIRFH